MTAPYHFYFVVVPRIASNRKEVVVWKIAVQILFLCCHEKKSCSQKVRIYVVAPQCVHM